MNSLSLSPTYYALIDRADLADRTKWNYKRAIDRMMEAGVNPKDRDALTSYANTLPDSIKADTKAALRIIFKEQEEDLKASATPDNLSQIQALLLNFDAINKTIHVQKPRGIKTHTWLSREQVEQITALPDLTTVRGLRDYIVLSVLLGAGVRREELTNLTFADILQQPTKTGMRDVIRIIKGKGDKTRSIPISSKLARHLKEWHKLAGDGLIVRAINKGGTINGSLSTQAVYDIVGKYGAMIGRPELQPHDCRRTFARLGYDAGVKIEQISLTLGHEDIETTMDYLGIALDIETPVSDHIPLSGD